VLKLERLALGRTDDQNTPLNVMLLLIEAETSGRMASLQTCPERPKTDGSNQE